MSEALDRLKAAGAEQRAKGGNRKGRKQGQEGIGALVPSPRALLLREAEHEYQLHYRGPDKYMKCVKCGARMNEGKTCKSRS